MKIIALLSSPNFESSQKFYKSFNFTTLLEDDHGQYISDGKYIYCIDKNRKGRNGLICFVDDVEQYTSVYNAVYQSDYDGAFIQDPNGIKILLKSLDEYPVFESSNDTKSDFGNPFGLGIETIDMEETVDFWKELGFDLPKGDPASDGYLSMKNDEFDLTIFRFGMCPHSFSNPSYSFFNGKEGNPIAIRKIKETSIPFSEEITEFSETNTVDNVIMKDPGGTGFFLFND